MTARRPAQTLDCPSFVGRRDAEHLNQLLAAFNNQRGDVEIPWNLRDAVNTLLIRLLSDLPDEGTTRPIHPALTDYGPESAARFFSQAHAIRPPIAARSAARPLNPQPCRVRPNSNISEASGQAGQSLSESSKSSIVSKDSGCQGHDPLTKRNERQHSSQRRGSKRLRRASTGGQADHTETLLGSRGVAQGTSSGSNLFHKRSRSRHSHFPHKLGSPQFTGDPYANTSIKKAHQAECKPLDCTFNDPGMTLLQYWLQATHQEVVVNPDDSITFLQDPQDWESWPSRCDASQPACSQEPGVQNKTEHVANDPSIPSISLNGSRESEPQIPSHQEREDSGTESTSSRNGPALSMKTTIAEPRISLTASRGVQSNLGQDLHHDPIFPFHPQSFQYEKIMPLTITRISQSAGHTPTTKAPSLQRANWDSSVSVATTTAFHATTYPPQASEGSSDVAGGSGYQGLGQLARLRRRTTRI
jgi:hypothetical protein